MAKNRNDIYVLIKADNGENILCPIDGKMDNVGTKVVKNEDCFEANVAGRYAGNIKLRSS